jgi:NAD/NADP transhydrogenase alpha subunit
MVGGFVVTDRMLEMFKGKGAGNKASGNQGAGNQGAGDKK